MILYEVRYTLYTVSPSETHIFSSLILMKKSLFIPEFTESYFRNEIFNQSHTTSCLHNMTTVVFLNFKNKKKSLFLTININVKVGRPTISKCPIQIDTSRMTICSFKTVSIHKIYSLRLKQH